MFWFTPSETESLNGMRREQLGTGHREIPPLIKEQRWPQTAGTEDPNFFPARADKH